MTKFFLIIFAFWMHVSPALAQNVSYDAARLANIVVEQSWPQFQQLLDTMKGGMISNLEKSGATKDASKVLTDEVLRGMNKSNLGRGYAQIITSEFTELETKQLLEFWSSPLAEKYNRVFISDKNLRGVMHVVMRDACNSANAQLSSVDRGSINSVCREFR
jgi:hypothetical protein